MLHVYDNIVQLATIFSHRRAVRENRTLGSDEGDVESGHGAQAAARADGHVRARGRRGDRPADIDLRLLREQVQEALPAGRPDPGVAAGLHGAPPTPPPAPPPAAPSGCLPALASQPEKLEDGIK